MEVLSVILVLVISWEESILVSVFTSVEEVILASVLLTFVVSFTLLISVELVLVVF